MLIVHVHAHVKSEHVEEFKRASVENARESVKESDLRAKAKAQNRLVSIVKGDTINARPSEWSAIVARHDTLGELL